jgi:small subunit ribosomal protein S20
MRVARRAPRPADEFRKTADRRLTRWRTGVYKPPNRLGRKVRSASFWAPPQTAPPHLSGTSFMANTSSAKKAVRKIARRTAVNKSRRSEMRTYVRKVEEAIASKDPKIAADALREAEPLVARAAQKGILHKNTAARKISRLTKRVKALAS